MLPVVGQQFCEPHAVDLTVTRSVATGFLKDDGGGFTATDAAGAVVLATEPRFIYREKGRRVLVDADGMPLLSMRRKVTISSEIYSDFIFSWSNLIILVLTNLVGFISTRMSEFIWADSVQFSLLLLLSRLEFNKREPEFSLCNIQITF